jgi:TfoX/Sxy family transcriptional regulator of competence genes
MLGFSRIIDRSVRLHAWCHENWHAAVESLTAGTTSGSLSFESQLEEVVRN